MMSRLLLLLAGLAAAQSDPFTLPSEPDAVVGRTDGFTEIRVRALRSSLCLSGAALGPVAPARGLTEFYTPEGTFLAAIAGSAQNAVAIVDKDKVGLFREILAFSAAPANECARLNPAYLRGMGQTYAIEEFIAFDAPGNRVALGNGVLSETLAYLYVGKDGVVHLGREKVVGDNGMMVTEGDRNVGGTGYEEQGQNKRVGKLHTHPNSDAKGFAFAPAHHPSEKDYGGKEADYYDVVVSPAYVYFINRRGAEQMVFARHNTFGDNPVKGYLAKRSQADAVYAKTGKWPAWFTDAFNSKSNPWKQ